MTTDKIKNEIMLRIRDLKLLERLQEMYDNSRYKSVNEFLNAILRQVACKEAKEDEMLEKLDSIEDRTNAIYDKVKTLGR